jgi:hypothetical protein
MHPHDPNQPQQPQPGYGHPQQPGGWGAPPPPPKKSSAGKAIGIGCGGALVGLLLIGGCAALLTGEDDTGSSDTSVTADEPKDAPEEEASKKAEPKKEKSQAEVFKECVAKEGTPTEKDAVKHVTKVTGADEQNNILDAAEIWTDYTGDMFGPHQKDAKLITSAFASCYTSENGLVTVYSKDGEILGNGNF